VAGFGMGCIFAPLITVAMRNIEPRLAGAASGVLNTIRQVGMVIGTATVGALLQNRLVSSLTSQAATRSAALPPALRGRFVSQLHESAQGGIRLGAGQNGGTSHQATGLPAQLAAELARIAHDVFTFGYVTAMRQTMLLPIVLLVIAALSCFALRTGKPAAEPVAPELEKAPTRA
jgi:hypothetical protein